MNIPKVEIPMDAEDSRYCLSFDTSNKKAAIDFFEEYGFVVFRNIFSADQCESSREAMWNIIETSYPGLIRNDPKSWIHLKTAGKYGLSSRGPCFDHMLVQNRQNPILAEILASIIDIPVHDLMISHDRFTIYRATDLNEYQIDGKKFLTGRQNIHLDLNPWWWLESSPDIIHGKETLEYKNTQDFIRENNLVVQSMGRHVQCVLNFADNQAQDGGTVVVPGFHRHLAAWTQSNLHLRKSLPWLHFADNKDGSISEEEQLLLERCSRVPMREGSVLIWDQTVAHGSQPNDSTNNRMAQFMKAFSRSKSFAAIDSKSPASSSRLGRRAAALRLALPESGSLEHVSELGTTLFGLDALLPPAAL